MVEVVFLSLHGPLVNKGSDQDDSAYSLFYLGTFKKTLMLGFRNSTDK